MVYAEIEREGTTGLELLVAVPTKKQLDEFMWAFEMTAPATDRCRYLTREQARKIFDLRKFGNATYETRYVLDSHDGHIWEFPAIMTNGFYDERRRNWRSGGGEQ